jgi:mannose-1-phosphate guanylyltransferase/mannose-6-phosphate isomerase
MTNSTKILPIILSGGFGTRIWPLSRQKMPKQFLDNLTDKETLFAKTLKITSNKDIFLPSICITHQDHKFLALQQYLNLSLEPQSIILEPMVKNTAMAIICACIKAVDITKNEKIKLLFLPCDHLISPKNLFEKSILSALETVERNIVTFGVRPYFPSTGYGYIKKSDRITSNCFAIEGFTEKPNLETASNFVKNGDYLWNSGIFLLQADILLSESQKYLPQQLELAKKAIKNSIKDGIFDQIQDSDYHNAKDVSIDYAILEKTKNIAVTTMRANWSDVGDFNSIYKIHKKDKNHNAISGDVVLRDTKNSLVKSENILITCLGLDNIIAIQTGDAILIADRSKSQDIKKITKDLLMSHEDKVKFHNRVYRPWGYYEVIQSDDNFKVKRILVNPLSSLSLQSHNFRSEHWIVINGIATVENNGNKFDLPKGESTFIATKHKHRLSNNTNEDLEIIEVQMGERVEESDIERFEDNYGRN